MCNRFLCLARLLLLQQQMLLSLSLLIWARPSVRPLRSPQNRGGGHLLLLLLPTTVCTTLLLVAESLFQSRSGLCHGRIFFFQHHRRTRGRGSNWGRREEQQVSEHEHRYTTHTKTINQCVGIVKLHNLAV